jgi:energy-coupling factor transporter transmembrane protein EcfT
MTRNEMKQNLFNPTTWVRSFFMLLYGFIFYVAVHVLIIVILFQFCVTLLAGKLNERLLPIGQSLSMYIYQILLYISYNSDEKPFPFASWPTPAEYNRTKEDLIVPSLPKEPEPPPKSE